MVYVIVCVPAVEASKSISPVVASANTTPVVFVKVPPANPVMLAVGSVAPLIQKGPASVSYTHLRAHETDS